MMTIATPPAPGDLAAFDGPMLLGFYAVERVGSNEAGDFIPAHDLGRAAARHLLGHGSILPVYDRDGYEWTGFLPAADPA